MEKSHMKLITYENIKFVEKKFIDEVSKLYDIDELIFYKEEYNDHEVSLHTPGNISIKLKGDDFHYKGEIWTGNFMLCRNDIVFCHLVPSKWIAENYDEANLPREKMRCILEHVLTSILRNLLISTIKNLSITEVE